MADPVIMRITEGLKKALGEDCGLGARLKLKFENQGIIFLDARARPNRVSNDDAEADCTLTMSLDTFQKMIGGEIDGTTAFMQGKLKVAGDMSVAMRVQPLLRRK